MPNAIKLNFGDGVSIPRINGADLGMVKKPQTEKWRTMARVPGQVAKLQVPVGWEEVCLPEGWEKMVGQSIQNGHERLV